MKRITIVMLACLAVLCSYGQQSLELKIKKASDLPMTANEHLYLIEITNSSNSTTEFTIVTENVNCSEIATSKQIQLNRQILDNDKTKNFDTSSIKANSSIEFYVKVSRKTNTPLGHWNCTAVKAITANNTISNTLVIKTLIPDPKNFN